MRYGDSPSSLSLASMHSGGGGGRGGGDFPIQSRHMASGGHVRVNRLKPRASIYSHTEHEQSVDLSWFELWRVQ